MDKTLTKGCEDFINDAKLDALAALPQPDPQKVRDIIAKSKSLKPLAVEETATLLAVESPELQEEIFETARELKRKVYGNRIVLFAPLYVGNHCTNDCAYCGFRKSLRSAVRHTLSNDELVKEVEALESLGHKRLILVFGEHPLYSPEFMADCVRQTYAVKKGKGEIRRVNINAAPLDIEGYKTMKAAGIGTYQIFQETYHHETYKKVHPPLSHKADFMWRLDGLSRAFEGGCDDMGVGALFGLYNWKFEVLGLVEHSLYLQRKYGVGPHTISFPRIKSANGLNDFDTSHFVSDAEYKRLVAILRLSVPYTGMIMTARETAELRREVLAFGVSQIDAGSRIEIGGYNKQGEQELNREQFKIGDSRPLDEVIKELVDNGYIPSFCTACYRKGRTGQHFMEFAIPGFINRLCTPNALTTLAEYLEDYAAPETKKAGLALLQKELEKIEDPKVREAAGDRISKIQHSDLRDLYF